jgi:hypothetical protein
MKNTLNLLILLLSFSLTLKAQKDFKMTHKPDLEWTMPNPRMEVFRLVNEKKNLFSFALKMHGELIDVFVFEMEIDTNLATVEKLPGAEGRFMITPHCAADVKSIYFETYATANPNLRLLWPVPKSEGLPLWDEDRELILKNVKRWEAMPVGTRIQIDQGKIPVRQQSNPIPNR